MRDRALAMKWVTSLAEECRGDSASVLEQLCNRGVSQKTIKDQMSRLRKQGLLSNTDIEAKDTYVSPEGEPARSKPFSPAPKSNIAKKKH